MEKERERDCARVWDVSICKPSFVYMGCVEEERSDGRVMPHSKFRR